MTDRKLILVSGIIFLFTGLFASCVTNRPLGNDSGAAAAAAAEKQAAYQDIVRIFPVGLNIIPPSSGAKFYKDDILYLAYSKNTGKIPAGHISFGVLQAYYSSFENNIPGPPVIFSPESNISFPCEAVTFCDNFQTMYYTRISESDKLEKIYHAVLVSDAAGQSRWKFDAMPLSFCTQGSVYSHPAVSEDGKTLIFASDNAASLGGTDLFVTFKANGEWSEPENLGDGINTRGNELFPFLDSRNNLFFSSDGTTGMGGYDILISKYDGKVWGKAVNPGGHINSVNDEIAFVINKPDGRTALFTSRNRRNGSMLLSGISLNDSPEQVDLSESLYALATAEAEKMNQILPVREDEEAKRAQIARHVADSLESVRIRNLQLEAERVMKVQRKADSLESVRIRNLQLEAEKIKKAQREADSLAAVKARVDAQPKTPPADVVLYKVQLVSSKKEDYLSKVNIGGKTYSASSYLYLGEYRFVIGEFKTLQEAKELQDASRKAGYVQAFVVAFRNNIRTNDPNLFK